MKVLNPRVKLSDAPEHLDSLKALQNRVTRQSPVFRLKPDSAKIARIEAAYAKQPDDASLLVTLAGFYLDEDNGGYGCPGRQRRRMAVDYLSRAYADNSDNEMLLLRLVMLLMADARYAVADSLLEEHKKLNGWSQLVDNLSAAVATGLADYQRAATLLRKALLTNPSEELRYALVTAYGGCGDFSAARDQLAALRDLDADSLDLLQAELALLLQEKRFADASDLLASWPDSSEAVVDLLKDGLFMAADENDSLYQLARKYLATDPDNSLWLNNGAWALAMMNKDLERALQMVERAVAISGDCALTYRNTHAVVLLKMGRVDEAISELNECLASELASSQAVNRYYLGEAYLEKGDRDTAINYFRQAAGLDSSSEYSELAEEMIEKLE
jgi:tetratricopeptide (TPR) repeat protein